MLKLNPREDNFIDRFIPYINLGQGDQGQHSGQSAYLIFILVIYSINLILGKVCSMKIIILGDVYSIHTRRWASYFAKKHKVYLAYLPRTSLSKVQSLFSPNLPTDLNLLPLGSHWTLNFLRIPRFVMLKISKNESYFSFGSRAMEKAIQTVNPDIINAHFLFLPDHGWLTTQEGFHPLVLNAWGSDISDIIKGSKNHIKLKKILQKADKVIVGDITG